MRNGKQTLSLELTERMKSPPSPAKFILLPLFSGAVSSLELAQEDLSEMLESTVDRASSWPIKAREYQCWHTPAAASHGLHILRETPRCNFFLTAETKGSLMQSRTTFVSETSAVTNPSSASYTARAVLGRWSCMVTEFLLPFVRTFEALRALAGT